MMDTEGEGMTGLLNWLRIGKERKRPAKVMMKFQSSHTDKSNSFQVKVEETSQYQFADPFPPSMKKVIQKNVDDFLIAA